MARSPFIWLALYASLTATPGAFAEKARPVRDPLDARAPTAALRHESAFDTYRVDSAVRVRPWTESNQSVNAAGGWRAYLRESQEASQANAPGPVVPGGQPASPTSTHRH